MPSGLPMVMQAYEPMEVIVTQDTTHIFFQNDQAHRRIFADGREWPKGVEPALLAIRSANGWTRMVTDGSIRSSPKPVISRGRAFSTSRGIPLHEDNETVIKERIYLDRATATSSMTRSRWRITRSHGPGPSISNTGAIPIRDQLWRRRFARTTTVNVFIGNQDYIG